jgi:phospholipid/cholesterol/gamma-HCH transport system permease protein
MVLRSVRSLGALTLRGVGELGEMGVFGARIAADLFKPPMRWRMIVKEIYKQGVLSLVIIGVSGLAVGMVLGLQGYNTLVRFGAEESIGMMVGLSLIRELSPVLTGLLLTGRAGSATTAEIGTMVATEQLDGLRMMSVNPVDLVVVPRAIALAVVAPLLNAIFTVLGLAGGWLVATGMFGMDPNIYFSSLERAVDFREDVLGSGLKALVFGVLIALIATFRGFKSAPSSAGVSAATTATVVQASVAILVFDFFLTSFWF